ncbi:Claudin-7-A [Bagarius yarrelli]|uniref:Claudin n=1 Tax=Bagarius yarrelli TaxID=175774 RepID=A0A556U6A8_BAGYA|nr:Claudin-7-A [Bagarius yarrelli]
MANSGVQLLGFSLSLVGIMGLIIGTVLPQWKMSAHVGDSIITAVATYQGLWMSCAFQSTGQVQCKIYDSVLQLDSSLQATRALMIVGIIVSIAGLGVACVGMKCTTCGDDNKVRKARTAMTGGIILLIGGSFLDVLGGALLAASCPQRKQVSKYTKNSTRSSSSTKEYV